MNSKLLAVLSLLLFMGAVVAGYMGYEASARPAQAAPAVAGVQGLPSTRDGKVAVVIAARDIVPGTPLAEADLYVEYLRQSPPGSFGLAKSVLGSKPWVEVKSGTVLLSSHFQSGGQLARLIRPDERAVAIGVDDVVGGGGFVSPGDYVDVLVFIRENINGGTRESAQVVLPALRVLSYGALMKQTENTGDEGRSKANEGQVPRTAVLAVPEKFTTRLMLASNSGNLRLAVRSAEAGFHERYQSGQSLESIVSDEMRNLIALSSLSPRGHVVAVGARRPATQSEPAVTVYRGKDIQRVIE